MPTVLDSVIQKYGSPETESTTPKSEGSTLDKVLAKYGEPTSAAPSDKGLGSDTLTDLAVGAMQVPGAIAGIGDVAAGLVGADRPFSKAADWLGEKTGIQPGKKAEELQKTGYSLERQMADKRLAEAWKDYKEGDAGIFQTIGKTLAEPRTIAGTVVQSVPSIAAGGVIGRAAKAVAPFVGDIAAAGIGEGSISAGQQMSQTQEVVDAQRAALGSLVTGVGVGATGALSGKLAGKLGISDIDVAAAGGRAVGETAEQAAKPFYRRIPEGMVVEGILEEAPQSAIEQSSQNIVEERPWDEGVAQAATMGAIAGGVMGGGMNILPAGSVPSRDETEKAEEAATEEAVTPAPLPTVEEPAETWTAPEVDDAVLNRVAKLLDNESRRAEAGRPTDRVTPGMVQAAEAIGVPDVGRFTDPTELLAEIDAAYKTIAAERAAKTPGQTVVDDLENIENKGPTVSAILNAKEAAAAAVDAQQAVNIPEQEETSATAASEEPIIPEREQAVPGAEVVYQDLRDTGPEAYTSEWLASTDTSVLKTLLNTITNKRGTGKLIADELERRKELENAEQIFEASEQPEGGQENRNVASEGAGVVPEGQEDRDIPGIEEAQVEVQDGKSTNQAAQTTAPEVAPVDQAAAKVEENKAGIPQADIEEGKYKKPSVDIAGIPIALENAAGTERTGIDEATKEPWSVIMQDHYGEIHGTNGADGDKVDVFVPEGTTDSKKVFIVDQLDKDGYFDEHKVVLGAKSYKEAAEIYERNYSDNRKGKYNIVGMSIDKFKNDWLTDPAKMTLPTSPKTQIKPVPEVYHPGVHQLAKDLAENGGVVKLLDDYDRVIGRTGSVNPDWFKNGAFKVEGPGNGTVTPSVGAIKAAVDAYENGKRLTFVQKNILKRLSEIAEETEQGDGGEFQWNLSVLRDTAKWAEEVTGEKYTALMELYIANGDITPDTITRYQDGLQDVINKATPVEEELLQPQFVPPTPAKQPVAQQGDIFATTKKERDELAARQGVANFAAAKDKKRNGNGEVEAEILTESGQEELPLVKSPDELPPEAVEAAEAQVPETQLRGTENVKPVADGFLSLIADFDRQQLKKYRLIESDAKPTIDKSGRLHAPHNGYEWIDGNTYAGGEWLPESEDSVRGKKPSRATILATPEVAQYLVEKSAPFYNVRVSTGKVFDKNGENVQLVYVEGGRALTKAITDLAPSRDKVLMSKEDAEKKGLQLGKTWKYSYKRHFNEEVKLGMYLGSDKSLDKQIVGYYYPDAVIRDIGAQKASGTTKLEAGGVLKVQNSGDLFNPNDLVIERFLDQADALPATKDSRSVTWTNVGNGFSARAYNSESMGPVLEIKSPSGAIVRKMKGRGTQDGEIVTDVEGTLDELFSGEAFNSFGEYFKNTPRLESGPMFSRPATRKQDDLAAIFAKLEYADVKADREAILGDHPLKDQIDYIDQNFEKIFNALVKSDKNPEGKVERKCR